MAQFKDFEDGLIDYVPPSTSEEKHQFEEAVDLGLTTVVAKERPIEKVISFIKGYPWRVNYYSHIAAQNDKTERLSKNLDKTTQRYKKIKDLTLYLDNPLDNNVADVNEMELDATINASIIPFLEDVVVMTMVSGRRAIFRVSEVNNVTYLQHTVYKIKIKFINFEELDRDLFKNLESKVIQTYVEDKNYITDFGAPILLEEDYKNKVSIKELRTRLLSYYLDLFYDTRFKYLNMLAKPYPRSGNQTRYKEGHCVSEHKILDEFMNKFFRANVDVDEDFRIELMRYPSYLDYTVQQPNILESILRFDKGFIFNVQKHVGFCIPNQVPKSEQQAVIFQDVEYIVDVIEYLDNYNSYANTIDNGTLFYRPNSHPVKDFPLKLKIDEEEQKYYIFSKAFYSEDLDKCSEFELIVRRFIMGESVLPEEIIPYCNDSTKWSRFEQFYCIPILIFMLNYFTKNTYSQR